MTLNKHFHVVFLVALALCVPSACGPGDDEDNGNQNPSSGGANPGGQGPGGVPAGGDAGRSGSSGTGGTSGPGGDGGMGGTPDGCASCAAEHRECDDEAAARCGRCLPRYTEVDGTCVPLPDCEPDCPDGAGCFIGTGDDGGKCFSCDFPPACDDPVGQTGRLLVRAAEDGAECVCETKPGYYTDASGENAVPCDADGDGWVTQAAQPAFEGSNVVIRLNTRCTVRTISQVKLQNEAGAEYVEALSRAVPLYESVRNDGGSTRPHDAYGSGSLPPSVLNSFTKACVSSTADFNDNGAADVSEWEDAELGGGLGWSARLESYFAEYARFAYYVELFNGFYESEDGGTYRITERRRTLRNGEGVPLVYPSGADEYWQSCPRHIDVRHRGDPASRAGGDLSAFGEEWDGTIAGGMTHTSQFKCVWLVGRDDYIANYSLENDPEVVFIDGSSLARRTTSGTTIAEAWSANSCDAEAGVSAGPSNARFPRFTCSTLATSSLMPGVHWASVGFEPYDEPADYERGCIDQCTERETPVPECYGCSLQGFGDDNVQPLSPGATCLSGVCDGMGTCGLCTPASLRCSPVNADVQQVCTTERSWEDNVTCNHGCSAGACYPECRPTTGRCLEGVPQMCDASGHFQNEPACAAGSECVGAGNCRVSDGQPCAAASECATSACTTFYVDVDGDDYGTTEQKLCGATPPAGYATNNTDCCDTDADAHPDQTSYFTSPREGCGGYNYNCANGEEREFGNTWSNVCGCPPPFCCPVFTPGWDGSVPSCGANGTYQGGSGAEQRTQACR